MPIERAVLIQKAAEFLRLVEVKRAADNAVNREKTALRRLFREYKNDIGRDDYALGIENVVMTLDVATSEKISVKGVIDKFMAGEISEAQLLEIIDVRKADAQRVLGGDVVESLSSTVKGTEVDIRLHKLEEDQKYKEATDLLPQVKPKTPAKPVQLGISKPRVIKQRPLVARLPTATRTTLRKVQ